MITLFFLLFLYMMRIDGPSVIIVAIAGFILFVWGIIMVGKVQGDFSLSSVQKAVYSIFWAGVAYGSHMTGDNLILAYIYLLFMFIVVGLCVYAESHEEKMAAFLRDIH